MTQLVQDAAKLWHEFPDEATPEMIGQALGLGSGQKPSMTVNPATTASVSAAPEQDASWLRYPRMLWQQAASGFGEGAGTPGELQAAANRGVNALLPPEQQGPPAWQAPSGNEVLDYLGRRGIGTTADVIPTGPWERAFAGAVRGTAKAAPLLLAGPEAAALPGALGAATGGAVEGLTGSPAAGMAAGSITGLGAQRLLTPSLSRLASRLGSSETLQEAGDHLQEAVRNWRSSVMPAQEAAVWGPVDAAVPKAEPVLLHNFRSELDDITRATPTQQPLMNVLVGGRQQALAKAMTTPVSNWGDARAIRTRLGNAMSNPRLIPDMDAADISRLYGAITEDLGNTAGALGANDLFAAANAESARLHQLGGGPLGRVASGVHPEVNDPRPEAVASRLLSGARQGGSDLAALRETVPTAVDELAAATLRVNPKLWHRFAPEAQTHLVSDPELRASIGSVLPAGTAAPGTRQLTSLVGARLGDIAGIIGGHFLPGASAINPLVAGAIGEAGGILAPAAARGVRRLALQPSRLMPGLAGTLGGNTLVPSEATVQEPRP